LSTGQQANLEVEFDPTVTGPATGKLTITSTSSSNGTAAITLTGTGVSPSFAVDLSWDAPSSSTDPVTGYDIYRSLNGTSTYQLINSSVDTQTTFTDTAVQAGQTYDYVVESVDSSGNESVPSGSFAVTIP
jgi:fibronectin type 3 domain-containing protein